MTELEEDELGEAVFVEDDGEELREIWLDNDENRLEAECPCDDPEKVVWPFELCELLVLVEDARDELVDRYLDDCGVPPLDRLLLLEDILEEA